MSFGFFSPFDFVGYAVGYLTVPTTISTGGTVVCLGDCGRTSGDFFADNPKGYGTTLGDCGRTSGDYFSDPPVVIVTDPFKQTVNFN